MRGIAVLCAVGATWVLATGWAPRARLPAVSVAPGTAALGAAAGTASAMLALVVVGIPAVAIAVGTLAAAVPFSLAAKRGRSRQMERLEAWPHVLAQVRSSLSSGATLGDALVDALERSGGVFGDLAARVRRDMVYGDGFSASLERARHDIGDPTTDRVLVTLAAANHAGGARVGTIVGVLGRSVADEVRLRRAHEAALTEQRLTVDVALVAPWVLLVLSVLTNPQAHEAFASPPGAMVVGVGAAATGLGWVSAIRTARLSRPPKVFR